MCFYYLKYTKWYLCFCSNINYNYNNGSYFFQVNNHSEIINIVWDPPIILDSKMLASSSKQF